MNVDGRMDKESFAEGLPEIRTWPCVIERDEESRQKDLREREDPIERKSRTDRLDPSRAVERRDRLLPR